MNIYEGAEYSLLSLITTNCKQILITLNEETKTNKTAPVFMLEGNKADIKIQNAPFVQAQSLFGIPPIYAITFDSQDYDRYTRQYPDIQIICWAKWSTTEWIDPQSREKHEVGATEGIWLTTSKHVCRSIEESFSRYDCPPIQDLPNNTNRYFCLDVRKLKQLWIKERHLYTIDFLDGTNLNVVTDSPSMGEIDEEVIASVKSLKQTLRAEIIGSEQIIL